MGITVVKREGRSFKDKLFLPGIATGMVTTLKHFVTNLKDVEGISDRYRGVHRLTKHEDDSEKCVACYMCATACPADCIFIEAEERFDGVAEKRPEEFKIDLLECVFCGYCVEACPCDAIRMDTGIFSFIGGTREEFVLDKKALMANERSKDFSND